VTYNKKRMNVAKTSLEDASKHLMRLSKKTCRSLGQISDKVSHSPILYVQLSFLDKRVYSRFSVLTVCVCNFLAKAIKVAHKMLVKLNAGFDEARFLFLKLAFVSGLKQELKKEVIKSDGALKSLERILDFAKSLEKPKSCDADFVSQYE